MGCISRAGFQTGQTNTIRCGIRKKKTGTCGRWGSPRLRGNGSRPSFRGTTPEPMTTDPSSERAESKYTWRERPLRPAPRRSAAERVADFLQIHGLFDEATAREQASRCVQCPEPACVAGCPLGIAIPEWLRLTAEGRFLEASAVLREGSPMAEVCADVCMSDRLCEGVCVLQGKAEPVSIGAIERFLNEYALTHGGLAEDGAPPNGFRVAVVGSGPGGLACADELSRRGFAVSVFDSDLVPGGLLVHGVPAFRLEKSIVQRRVDLLKNRGVVFRLGVTLGREMSLAQLRSGFDAVFIGLDARRARALEVPGAQLAGVVQALPFIVQQNTRVPLALPEMDVRGCRVVVIGGGDTAMDCLRTAIRCGAEEVVGVCRRDEAHLACGRAAFEEAKEEGAGFRFGVAPVEFLGRDGRVRAVRLMSVERGGDAWVPVAGSGVELEADWVFLALGFDPVPFQQWEGPRELRLSEWGGIVVDEQLMTSVRGVFAGGDIVRGPGLVLDAVKDGRQAAESIDRFLAPEKALHRGGAV